MKHKAILIAFVFSICTCLYANHKCLYTTEQLTSNIINCVAQDKRGYIWVATAYGLNRFDGARFRHYMVDDNYNSSNANVMYNLKENYVGSILVTAKGKIVITTAHYIEVYDEHTCKFNAIDKEFIDLKSIMEDKHGNIYAIDKQLGVYNVNISDMQTSPVVSINEALGNKAYPCNLVIDSYGLFWISTEGNGIACYNPKTKSTKWYGEEYLGNGYCTTVVESKGKLYIVGAIRISQVDRRTGKITPVETNCLHTVNFRCATTDNNGILIAGTFDDGMFRMDNNGVMQPMQEVSLNEFGFSTTKVVSILTTKSGLWLGCHQVGLLHVSDSTPIFSYHPTNGEALSLLQEDRRNGLLYVGESKKGVKVIDTHHNILRHFLDNETVISLLPNSDGSVYAGTYSRGLVYVNAAGTSKTIACYGDRIKGIARVEGSPEVYFAVNDKGIFCFNEKTGKTEMIPGCSDTHINTMMLDKQGNILIGHCTGIDLFNIKNKTYRRINKEGHDCNAMCISSDGSMWIATSTGLKRYKNKQLYNYDTNNGLSNNIVCSVLEDSQKRIWISTFKGLCMIIPESDPNKIQVIPYYKGNGLQYNAYAMYIGCNIGNGNLCFGNDYGYTYLRTETVSNKQESSRVYITSVLYDNSTTDYPWGKNALEDSKELTFNYESNSFSLCLSTLTYNQGCDNIEYRINGGEWIRISDEKPMIVFSHAAYGKYYVEARTISGNTTGVTSKWTISILPPWYLSWWAYLLYTILIIAILCVIWYFYRQHRLVGENEQRIQFYVDISHELRSPLTMIKSPLTTLMSMDFDSNTTRELRHIEKNTNRLLTLVNQILSLRKIEKEQLHIHKRPVEIVSFIHSLMDVYSYQAEKRSIKLSLKCEGEMLTEPNQKIYCEIDTEWFDKTIDNLLGNAMKYVVDGKGEIDVVLKTVGSMLHIEVIDNGEGIDETTIDKIFKRFYQPENRVGVGTMGYGIGLNLAYKVVKMHQGDISARNRNDSVRGSVFTIKIPYLQNYTAETVSEHQAKPVRNINIEHHDDITNEKRKRNRRKTNFTLYFVDDDESLRNYIFTEMSDIFKVKTFKNGDEALKHIIEEQPDLVVSDVAMPVMDGFTLLHRIKSNTRTSHIPVILLSSRNETESRMKGLEKGADAYVDKPFNLEELEMLVSTTLENRLRIKGKYSGAQEQTETIQNIEIKSNDDALMERIMNVINKNLTDSDFNVTTLSAEVGLSRVQLYRRIKELTGMPAGDFIRGLRMQQAARLFEKGDLTVSQVAYSVGFSSPTNFSVAFKKYFGVPPVDYKKNKVINDDETK